MNRNEEELFVERFSDFKNIVKRSRAVLAEQTAVDIYLISELAFHVVVSTLDPSSAWKVSFISIILMLARTLTILLARGHKGNFIGMGLGVVLLFILGLSNDDNLFEMCILALSIFLQIRRIYRIMAANVVKQVYGAPGFNGYLTYNEISSDPLLKKRVFEQVNEASDAPSVKYGLRCIHCTKGLSCARVFAALLLIAGILMMGRVAGKISRYDRASEVISVSADNKGKYFKYTIDKVYSELSTGTDSMTGSSFLVSINGKCLMAYVSNAEKERFKSSEAYWSGPSAAKLTNMEDFSQKSASASSEPFTVVGTVVDINETDTKTINFVVKKKEMNKLQFDMGKDELITDICIQVIDLDRLKKTRTTGIYIVFIGAASALLTNFLFAKSKYEAEYI